MSYSKCGDCPLCGSHMYHHLIWHIILPPPVYRTCDCFPEKSTKTFTGTDTTPPDLKDQK